MVIRTQFAAFKKYDAFATVVDEHTYAMPDDFVQCLSYGLQYAATPFITLDWITERDWLESESERNVTTGDPRCFWITHKDETTGLWQFRMHPTPSRIMSINRAYLSMAQSIRLTVYAGDHVLDRRFPTQHVEALVAGAATHFPQYLDSTTISVHNSMLEKAIKDMSNKSEPVAGNIIQKRLYGSQARFRGSRYPGVNITSIRT
jgi:hypothetical protein